MPANKLYSEIFEEYEEKQTKKERIDVLKKYDHPRFRLFLQAAFHPQVQFDVEIPLYRPAPEPAGLNFTYLDMEIVKIYRFLKNHPEKPEGLTSEKAKQLLLVILESLHKDEAELFTRLIRKNLGVKNLTSKIVEETFPGLL